MSRVRLSMLALVSVAIIVVVAVVLTSKDNRSPLDTVDRSNSFELVEIPSDLHGPTGIAATPDGSLIVIEKGGWKERGVARVLRLRPEDGNQTELLKLDVCSEFERGLVGLVLAPNFARTGEIYLYRTLSEDGCEVGPNSTVRNRVSRFRITGDEISEKSEVVLIDDIPARDKAHVGGGLAFLPDGTMLVATGEGLRPTRSRDLSSLNGKILRITPDPAALVPAGNPYASSEARETKLVWASGLRNPFRVVVDKEPGKIVISDVGSDPPRAAEELNIGTPGADFGWPDQEGAEPAPDKVTPPVWSYKHREGCTTIIAGTFVEGERYPGLNGALLVTDFGCGQVLAVHFDGNKVRRIETLVAHGKNRHPVGMTQTPDGRVYLVDVTGALLRLEARSARYR